MTHPHDPYEEGGVAYEEEADGQVVEQSLGKPGLKQERAGQLSQRLRVRLILLLWYNYITVIKLLFSSNDKYFAIRAFYDLRN